MDREKLYLKLPVFLQNLAMSIEGGRIRKRRYNARFHALLDEYRQREQWDRSRTLAFRDGCVATFVDHAARTVPYYRDLFAREKLESAEFQSLDDLKRLPVLAKDEVREDPSRFFSDAIPADQVTMCHTSGSTGGGLVFPVTHDAHRQQWALWWRYRMWHGMTVDTWCLYFGGRSIAPLSQRRGPYWRTNRPGRQIMYSAYHLSDATADAYLDHMQASGAKWIHGYPSMVSLIANYALQRGRTVPMKWVTLGSESLLPHQAKMIEQAFGVKTIQNYGQAEAVANFSQHPDGVLRVDEDFSAVEFEPIGDGQHRILGTNFTNPAFCLIRYEVGDIATLADQAYVGDVPGRVVAQVDGRREDYIITRSGVRLGRLDHIFKDMTQVREAQLHQNKPGHMTVRIVKAADFGPADEQSLREEVTKRVGEDVAFDIAYVEELTRTGRGKLRFVISEIEDGKLEADDKSIA